MVESHAQSPASLIIARRLRGEAESGWDDKILIQRTANALGVKETSVKAVLLYLRNQGESI